MTDITQPREPHGATPEFRQCRWGLYGIIDASMAGQPHALVCQSLVDAGVRVIQLRDKTSTFEELMDIGKEIRQITAAASVTFIINDNPYLARELDADGVHIGQDDFPVDIVREIIGPDKIIGLSTHSKQQAIAATTCPVDYIGVGPVYDTSTKKTTNIPVGTSLLRWIKGHIPLPTVAIGGITEHTIPDVLAAGATNVAIIGDLMKAPDLRSRAETLRTMADQYVDWK